MEDGKNYKGNGDPDSRPVAEICKKSEKIISKNIDGLVLIGNFEIIIWQCISIIEINEIDSGENKQSVELGS